MFEREHHLRITQVLAALDAQTLAEHGCLFGGDTAIVLARGEYRESVDIDFLVSEAAGYRALRQRLTGPAGLASLAREGHKLTPARGLRADQYVSRDSIDLAMLRPGRPLLNRAIAKAATAYGESVARDLARAVRRLGERKGRLDVCMEALQIDRIPKAGLWDRLRRLSPPPR